MHEMHCKLAVHILWGIIVSVATISSCAYSLPASASQSIPVTQVAIANSAVNLAKQSPTDKTSIGTVGNLQNNVSLVNNESVKSQKETILTANINSNTINSGVGDLKDKSSRTSSQSPSDDQKSAKQTRSKRSQYYSSNSLHNNLDDLLNIRRHRRALRSKRNSNYDEFLASLLAAEEQENRNANGYNNIDDVNVIPIPQSLYYLLQSRYDIDKDGYVDLDKLNQYYYDNSFPLFEIDSDATSDIDDNQDLPVAVQPYAQQVIPVLPYTLPNRYQRIRRSYYKKYHNPLSSYAGLRRKRNRADQYNFDVSDDIGQWGKIVSGRNERSNYDEDGEQEANKIYSLASILASQSSPDEFASRYKRSPQKTLNIM